MNQQDLETVAWKIQEVLQQIAEITCQNWDDSTNAAFLPDEDSSNQFKLEAFHTRRSTLRRCLRRLDRTVQQIRESCENPSCRNDTDNENQDFDFPDTSMATCDDYVLDEASSDFRHLSKSQDDEEFDPEQQQDDCTSTVPLIPANLRAALFAVLLGVDTESLDHQDDSSALLTTYFEICEVVNMILAAYSLPLQALQPTEAAGIMNKVNEIVQSLGQSPSNDSKEWHFVAGLLSHVNQVLCNASCYRKSDDMCMNNAGNDHRENSGESDEATPCFETLVGSHVHITEFLKLYVPKATRSFLESSDRRKMHDSSREVLLLFVEHIFLHVSQAMALGNHTSLSEWIKEQIIHSRHDDSLLETTNLDCITNEILTDIEDFASEYCEFTLDSIDNATSMLLTFNAQLFLPERIVGDEEVNSSSAGHNGSHDVGGEQYLHTAVGDATRLAKCACLLLGLLAEQRTAAQASIARTLWVAHTKLSLAYKDLVHDFSEGLQFPITEVLVKFALFVLSPVDEKVERSADGNRSSDFASCTLATDAATGEMDSEMQHTLSLTFLSALDFPVLLYKERSLLSIIADLSTKDAAMRHLVQSVAYHALLLPTFGGYRSPTAMDKVLRELVQIGKSSDASREDQGGLASHGLWDNFFREQVVMSEMEQVSNGGNSSI